MVWQATTKHIDPAYIEVAVGETGRWSITMTPNLEVGETLTSPTIVLKQIDPPTYETITGFVVGSPTVAVADIVFNWTGSVLVRGRTYELQIEYVASINSTPVTLLTIGAVA